MVAPGKSHNVRFWRLRLLAVLTIAGLLGWLALGKLDLELFSSRIHTVEATFGEVETRLHGIGVILRHEELILSPRDGEVTLLVADGRSVRVGDPVAELAPVSEETFGSASSPPVSTSSTPPRAEIDAQMDELRRKIADLESRLSDAEKVMKDALTTGDSQLIKDAQSRRDRFAAELSEARNRMRALEQERVASQAITARVTSPSGSAPGHTVVRTPRAGIAFATFDGLEGQYVPGLPLDEVTFPAVKEQRVVDGNRVAGGDPILRIADQQRVELVVQLTRGAVSVGTQLEVAMDVASDRTFLARVIEVLTENNVTYARLRLDRFDELLLQKRRVDVTLSAQKAQGVIVPTRAIIESRGRQGVYLMLGEQPIFREVRILGGNEREAVVDGVVGVPVGARVVTNPEVIQAR